MTFFDPDFPDRLNAAADEARRQRLRKSMPVHCQIGRRVPNPIFDDQHNWTDPCPNDADVTLGLIVGLRVCQEHADAIVAAYNRDLSK